MAITQKKGRQTTKNNKCIVCKYYLRNRKHVPYFYRVIETRVEVWENEKYRVNTSRS